MHPSDGAKHPRFPGHSRVCLCSQLTVGFWVKVYQSPPSSWQFNEITSTTGRLTRTSSVAFAWDARSFSSISRGIRADLSTRSLKHLPLSIVNSLKIQAKNSDWYDWMYKPFQCDGFLSYLYLRYRIHKRLDSLGKITRLLKKFTSQAGYYEITLMSLTIQKHTGGVNITRPTAFDMMIWHTSIDLLNTSYSPRRFRVELNELATFMEYD